MTSSTTGYFNPRSPWGERPGGTTLGLECDDFNPRSPWGERLPDTGHRDTTRRFQSTLPVGGATRQGLLFPDDGADFNPRSPWGERLDKIIPDPENF